VKRLFVYARFLAARIGISGVAGLALLGFAAAFLLLAVRPLQDEVRTLAARTERLSAPGAARTGEPVDPAAAIATLLSELPTLDKAPTYLARLQERAREHGIALEAGEYHVAIDRDARVTRYQVRFPLKGGYVEIRRFVAAAMDAVPTMILEEVSIRRTTIDDPRVEARVQFALLFAESK
jgi:hypothetical protein